MAKISNGTGLNHTALAFRLDLLDFQVAKVRLDRQPVSEAVALGLPSSSARSLEIGDVLNVMAPN